MLDFNNSSPLIGEKQTIDKFEKRFAEFFKVKYAVAVSSGTMADTIALAVLKQFYPGNKVIVPALTFIAQINSLYYNHLEPVFYDYNEKFWLHEELEYNQLEEQQKWAKYYKKGKKVKLWKKKYEKDDLKNILCFFPVHLLGQPYHIEFSAFPFDFPVVEDACEALGSKDVKYCGTKGDMGTFSFFPSHTLALGEGGMIVTNREEYADMAKKLRNHGRVDGESFHFDTIGFNGKMPAKIAELGLTLMNRLPEDLQKRNENYLLMGGEQKNGQFIVPHGFPVFYDTKEERDRKREELKSKGIDSRNMFSSIPTQEKAYEHLGYKYLDFPYSEWVGDHGLYVPCHQNLSREEVLYIKKSL